MAAAALHGPRTAAAAAAPLHVGELEIRNPQGGRNAGRLVTIVAVGGEAVDLFGIDARILAGRDDGFQGQDNFGVR